MKTDTGSSRPVRLGAVAPRGRRYSGIRTRSTSYRLSPAKYSVLTEPVSKCPRVATGAAAGAASSEPGVTDALATTVRAADGVEAQAAAQSSRAGEAKRMRSPVGRWRRAPSHVAPAR